MATVKIDPITGQMTLVGELTDAIEVKPGDVVIRYRPKYDKRWYMFWKYLLQRGICFFTTEYWLNERSANVSHAEFVQEPIFDKDGNMIEFRVFTMEPPFARFKNRRFKRSIIFRYKHRGEDYAEKYTAFMKEWYGRKYEYWKIAVFILDWAFRTNWFSKHWDVKKQGVCSEMVATGCRALRSPCSNKDPKSTDPDAIFDYCKAHPEDWEIIFDEMW